MADISLQKSKAHHRSHAQTRPIGGPRFDYFMLFLCTLFTAGIYTDLWAHDHLPESLEDFFTPWHAALYSSFFIISLALVATTLINRARGHKAIPAGYEFALIGVALFLFSGVGDMFWHQLLGVEQNMEASFSPPHLALVVGGTLILGGPFYALWKRPQHSARPDFLTLLPALLSITFIIAVFDVILSPGQPFTKIRAIGDPIRDTKVAGIFTIITVGALLTGVLLLLLRRWRLPFGAITLVLGLYGAFLSLKGGYHVETIAIAGITGLLLDLFVLFFRPSFERIAELRLFAFLTPVLLFSFYFLAQHLITNSISWTLHLWAGTIFVAGLVGLLLSMLVAPPTIPQEVPSGVNTGGNDQSTPQLTHSSNPTSTEKVSSPVDKGKTGIVTKSTKNQMGRSQRKRAR